MMDGTAEIISGFLSFGMLHIKTSGFQPWQWLMITTGILTLITAGALVPGKRCLLGEASSPKANRTQPRLGDWKLSSGERKSEKSSDEFEFESQAEREWLSGSTRLISTLRRRQAS